jgi:dTMP kinase
MTRGVFITFEGIEGCGKTTQIRLLAEHLRNLGYTVILTREPGGTPAAESIRAILLDPANKCLSSSTELLLYAAARAQHVHEVIRPAVESGSVVLCDRFADSTTAYQGGGRGLPMDKIEMLHAIATGGMNPDCTLLFDLPAADGLARTHGRGAPDRIEAEPLLFHERVREAFLHLAAKEPERFAVIDASAPVEIIAEKIRQRVDQLLAGVSNAGCSS